MELYYRLSGISISCLPSTASKCHSTVVSEIWPMSAPGYQQTFSKLVGMSAFHPKVDFAVAMVDVSS